MSTYCLCPIHTSRLLTESSRTVGTDQRCTCIQFPLLEGYTSLVRSLSPMFRFHLQGSDKPSRNVDNQLPNHSKASITDQVCLNNTAPNPCAGPQPEEPALIRDLKCWHNQCLCHHILKRVAYTVTLRFFGVDLPLTYFVLIRDTLTKYC